MSSRRPCCAGVRSASTVAVILWYSTPGPSTYVDAEAWSSDAAAVWLSVRRNEVLFKVFCSSGKSLAKVKQDSCIVVFQQDLSCCRFYLDTAIEQ
jgi:hypothetical protein